MTMPDPTPDATERFSDRVENYLKYRPRYPQAVLDFLGREIGLAGATVADIGSGTGFLAELFLRNGHRVIGVEPNAEMRRAGDARLAAYATPTGTAAFSSVDGTAEATGLPDRSVDHIVAGQAFHWFDAERARREFVRILKPGGYCILVWNSRDQSTPFMRRYEDIVYGGVCEYRGVSERNVDDTVLARFYAPDPVRQQTFENGQTFDWDGLRGRLLSSSYVPLPGDPAHAPLMAAVSQLFDNHQQDGRVSFSYVTRLYYGKLSCRDD